jgi:mevalonate kinase
MAELDEMKNMVAALQKQNEEMAKSGGGGGGDTSALEAMLQAKQQELSKVPQYY